VTPARLALLASGGGRTLENLQQRISTGAVPAEIVLVIVSRASSGAAERARRLGLPVLVIGKDNRPDPAQRAHLLQQAVLEARPDWVLLAGWLALFPIPPQLEGRVLNIHPALLPSYGGAGFYGRRVHEAAARDQARIGGCTVHFADAAYDRGPVLLQSAVRIPAGAGAEEIAARVFAAEVEAFPEALAHLIAGRARLQDGAVVWSL